MRHEIESSLNIRSISFLVAFRSLSDNDLKELPPGIFDSLASLTSLYVLLQPAVARFVSYLLETDIFLFRRPGPARCGWTEPLFFGRAWSIFFCSIYICNFLMWRVEIKVLVVVGNEA